MTKEEKQAVIDQFGANGKDTGSTQVQVALLTSRILELTGHMKEHPKDVHSRRGLIALVSSRRKLLKYFQKKNYTEYQELIATLGLRR